MILENTVPMEALKAFYQEISIIHIIEIESYDEYDQFHLIYQITASHPDLGLVTIRQGLYNCEMLATYSFDFDHLVTIHEESDDMHQRLLDRYVRLEKWGEEGFLLIQLQAKKAGIPIAKMKHSCLTQAGEMLAA